MIELCKAERATAVIRTSTICIYIFAHHIRIKYLSYININKIQICMSVKRTFYYPSDIYIYIHTETHSRISHNRYVRNISLPLRLYFILIIHYFIFDKNYVRL